MRFTASLSAAAATILLASTAVNGLTIFGNNNQLVL